MASAAMPAIPAGIGFWIDSASAQVHYGHCRGHWWRYSLQRNRPSVRPRHPTGAGVCVTSAGRAGESEHLAALCPGALGRQNASAAVLEPWRGIVGGGGVSKKSPRRRGQCGEGRTGARPNARTLDADFSLAQLRAQPSAAVLRGLRRHVACRIHPCAACLSGAQCERRDPPLATTGRDLTSDMSDFLTKICGRESLLPRGALAHVAQDQGEHAWYVRAFQKGNSSRAGAL